MISLTFFIPVLFSIVYLLTSSFFVFNNFIFYIPPIVVKYDAITKISSGSYAI